VFGLGCGPPTGGEHRWAGGRVPSVPALAAGAATAARLRGCSPGVARANSTGVGMRVICDVNWDTHRAHTHVYRSTTDATTHRDPVCVPQAEAPLVIR